MSDSENNKNLKPSTKEVFDELMTTVDRLFAEKPYKGLLQSMDDFFGTSNDRSFPVEIIENETDYRIKAMIPGIKRQDIDIEMLDQGVIINVKNQETVQETNENKGLFKRKSTLKNKSRTIRLSKPIDGKKASASHRDGVLEIKVPKLKGKRIAIND
ncbi:Hsp20/alpha crystallin family protein [Peribacillus cavernae]|uniref:Hsp20/alpha crystallin family protein n=1 Tax=Peribacillus cavernae TaxID=1674310 RepID=A0A433HLS6_9BACI|nr:Hsp20/alpha crystallin family protein [Peribacillus cavernae]MDQ0218944.1 HSP20 family protein [Peribacillus cavernae]RUQ29346.1 Hsp20/alpha crystallin family protein [Peribacillus cavernae]